MYTQRRSHIRLGPLEIILIVLGIALVIGTTNLPTLGKKAGLAVKEFKENSKDITDVVKSVNSEIKDIKTAVTMDLSDDIEEAKVDL